MFSIKHMEEPNEVTLFMCHFHQKKNETLQFPPNISISLMSSSWNQLIRYSITQRDCWHLLAIWHSVQIPTGFPWKKSFMLFQPLRITWRLQLRLHCHMTADQSHWAPLSPTCSHPSFVFHRSIQNKQRLWLVQLYQEMRHSPRRLLDFSSLFHFHSRYTTSKGPLQLTHRAYSDCYGTPQVTTYPRCSESNSDDLPGHFVSFSLAQFLPALPFGSRAALAFFFSLLSLLWFVNSSLPFWNRILYNYQLSKHH